MKHQRYLFDTSFGVDAVETESEKAGAAEEPPPEPTFSDAEVAEARETAYAAGHAQGVAETLAALEQRTGAALDAIAGEMSRTAAALLDSREQTRADALALAIAIARRIAPAIGQTETEQKLLDFLSGALAELREEPRVVIRLADSEIEPLAEKLEGLGRNAGFPGQVITLGEAELEPGDCRIEWADGGLEMRIARKLDTIDGLTAAFFAPEAEGAPADAAPGAEGPPPAEGPPAAEGRPAILDSSGHAPDEPRPPPSANRPIRSNRWQTKPKP